MEEKIKIYVNPTDKDYGKMFTVKKLNEKMFLTKTEIKLIN